MSRWQDRAACRGMKPRVFDLSEMTEVAARTCLRCPVRLECVSEALDRHHTCDCGIWGATTPKQRERIRRRRVTLEVAWQETAELVQQAADLVDSVDRLVEQIGSEYGGVGAAERSPG